mgnify:CR=1 FL=1
MKLFRSLVELGAFIGVPLAILACFALFRDAAQIRIGILDFNSDYFLGVMVAVALAPLLQLPIFPEAHRKVLTLLWLARCGTTLGVMLAYEGYYTLDSAQYFHRGMQIGDPFSLFAFGQGTDNLEAVTALILAILPSFTAAKVVYSFVGLIAVYIVYRAATLYLRRDMPDLLLVLGVFPSILFWNSILGKDPITSLGIALVTLGAVGFLTRRRMIFLVVVAAGLLTAAFIRSWLGLIFLAPLVATIFLTGRASLGTKIGFSILGVPGFLVALQTFQERFAIQTASDLVQRADTLSQGWARGGSAQQIEGGLNSLTDMILFMPVGAFTALFRPLPGEVLNPFGMLAGLENAFLLGLIVYGVYRRGVGPVLRDPVLLWAILTLLAWSAIYGFVSYQNLGTAFRFRAQVAPIMLLLALYLASGIATPRARAGPGRAAPTPAE